MQKLFDKEFITANCGCYNDNGDISKLKQAYKENTSCPETLECLISLDEILNSNIPIKDKYWFVCKKLATKEQNQQIAISVAEIVLPIFEAKYPENKAPKEAIEAAKLYITGHISLEQLLLKRKAAYASYAAAYASYAAASAAYAAAYAAAAADAAAYASYAAAYAAASAAYAAADASAAADAYQQKLLNYLIEFCKNN